MLEKLTEIAPLGTWALSLGAAVLMLCGFVAYGHARVVGQAYGRSFSGVASSGLLETLYRVCAALLAGGVLLWGLALDWSPALLALPAAGAGVALALEAVARVSGGDRRPDSG